MIRWLHRLVLIAVLAAARPAAADPGPGAPTGATSRPPVRHWLRAAIEEVAALAGGTTWYWLDRDRQVADWDYPSIQDRLTFEAWRLDNNPFPINFAAHAVNGTGFHLLARSNGLSLAASAGYGIATSMAWEYLLEFREKISINDVLVTPGSGIAIGEFFHWMGRYLDSAPRPRPWQAVPRWTLGFSHTLHSHFDGRPPAGGEPDDLGFSSDIWHRFRVAAGPVAGRFGGDRRDDGSFRAGELYLAGELAGLPGYLAPGEQHRFFADGNLTRARLRVAAGDGAGVEFDADTWLLGWHEQRVDAGGRGRATTWAASLAYRYRKQVLGEWTDRVAVLHLPGLAGAHHILGRGWRLSLSAGAHLDFAGIDSPAYPAWKAAHPDAIEKTILRKHGYYYAWGASIGGRAELTTRWLTLGYEVFQGRYDSQEGLDKDQEQIDTDVDAHDVVGDLSAFARVRSPWGADLELRWDRQDHGSHLGGVHARQTLDRFAVLVGATF